jgi:hypothetical protein
VLYPGETVCLVSALSEVALPKESEGTVIRVVRDGQDLAVAAEVNFHTRTGALVVTVPLEALQAAVSRAGQDRTAVVWGLSKTNEEVMEAAMHSMLDSGFSMDRGLNLVRLVYDRKERWWQLGERMTDPTGALAASAQGWDGCIVAFAGHERFQLEFRLKGRHEPAVLLHERESLYAEQNRSTGPAATLARVLMNLYNASAALYCAFPVADPWLLDEDWRSLLRPPYYPDFFLLPSEVALDFPDPFRKARLTGDRTLATTLPVKFAPHDEASLLDERERKLENLRKWKALGEKYYDQMYETHLGTTGLYSSVKDAFLDAISAANELGLKDEADTLSQRLEHIKNVFRSQFS